MKDASTILSVSRYQGVIVYLLYICYGGAPRCSGGHDVTEQYSRQHLSVVILTCPYSYSWTESSHDSACIVGV